MHSTVRRKFNESAFSPINQNRGSVVFKTIGESDKHLFKSAHLTSTRKYNVTSDSKMNTSALRNFSAVNKNRVGQR